MDTKNTTIEDVFKEKGDAVFRDAISRLGETNQFLMAVEECSELQNALMKFLRKRVQTEDVIDEIADVTILCRQLAIIFGQNKVTERVNFKIDRLKSRLETNILL